MSELITSMSAPEADFYKVKIHEELSAGTKHFESAIQYLTEYRDRQGWLIHGYATFRDFFNAELESRYGSRATMYRLLSKAEVTQSLSDGEQEVEITMSAATHLARIPKEHRKGVWDQAVKFYGPQPKADEVDLTVREWLKENGVPAKPKPLHRKARLTRAQMLAKIRKACGTQGREFIRAIEAGIIKMTIGDIMRLSEMEPEAVIQVYRLIMENRWPVKRCVNFVSIMPTEEHSILKIITMASANGGAWKGTIKGADITVKIR